MSASTRNRTEFDSVMKGFEMYTMHEALAREHMREQLQSAHRSHLASELAAARRWHRWQSRARTAHTRHAQRAERAARVSAVAEHSWA